MNLGFKADTLGRMIAPILANAGQAVIVHHITIHPTFVQFELERHLINTEGPNNISFERIRMDIAEFQGRYNV
jgi:hypothetical protein